MSVQQVVCNLYLCPKLMLKWLYQFRHADRYYSRKIDILLAERISIFQNVIDDSHFIKLMFIYCYLLEKGFFNSSPILFATLQYATQLY